MQAQRSIYTRYLIGSLIFAWLATGPVRAETCPPLRLVNQVRMVSTDEGTRMLVPVTINGSAALLKALICCPGWST